MRLRILPLILFFAFTSVVVKVFDAIVEKANSPHENFINKFQALAQDGKPSDKEEKSSDKAETNPTEDTETPTDSGTDAEKSAQSDGKEKLPPAKKEEEEAVLSPNYSGAGPNEVDVNNTTEMEKNLLGNLSNRRKELEEWNASISMKESILNATEKKINRKMEELNQLKSDVSKLLQDYNEKEDKKILQLVKIYENMKPQNAAEVFEKMDMDILINLISKMKEAKVAKILDKMKTEKAQNITEKLAQQRRISVN